MLTLYQAEWCPFSSAVREVLTELGVDFVARQVEPWPEQRARLLERVGTDRIPTLETDDGRFFVGTRAIYAYLQELEPGRYAAAHRRRFADHHPARESDVAGRLLEHFPPPEPAEPSSALPADSDVVHLPQAERYELRLSGRPIGLAAYRRHDGRMAVTHTEVDEAFEGRGFGSRLVAEVLDDARRQGLDVVPLCPFVASFIQRHPEYEDLVASGYGNREE